jgi:hypothetical protein
MVMNESKRGNVSTQESRTNCRVPAIIENEIPVKTTHILLSPRFLCRPTTLYIIAPSESDVTLHYSTILP